MISKSATNPSNNTRNFIFTVNARTAWELLLKSQAVKGKVKVLLPSYIGYTEREGSGVFDPIELSGAAFGFYKVNEQLAANLEELESKLKQGDVDFVLIIHYFGFCKNNMVAIKALCERYGAFLVEDCAHAFHAELRNPKLGNYGDFAFYSLHKYFATSCGGMLQVNSDKLQLKELPAEKKAPVEVLEQYIKTNFEEVAAIRRRNYKAYEEKLSGLAAVVPLYKLEADDIPQSFAMRVPGLREKLYFFLMDKGIPTIALYYRMISQLHKEEYPVSFELAGDILNLPVHQDIILDDIVVICDAIQEFFTKGQH